MISFNVSFGVFAFLPEGWIFMLCIIVLESIILSKMLFNKWYVKRAANTAVASNLVSGTLGIGASLLLNGGWWLVVWFPWVSSHELNITEEDSLKIFIIYYLCAFVISLILEYAVNFTMLRNQFTPRQIRRATLAANGLSYLAGSFVLYAYSFRA